MFTKVAESNRLERQTIGRSVVWNWAGILISGLIQFVTLPMMIHHLGNFYYGIWVLLSTFVGYYGLLDFGIGTSLRRFTSRLSGANQVDELHQTVAAALHLSTVTAVVIIVTTVGVAYIAPGFFKLPAQTVPLTRMLFLLVGISVAIMFPARTLAACLHGLQRFDLANIGSIATAVLRGACIVAALYAGFGVTSVAVITVVTALFSLVYYVAAVRWVQPEIFAKWVHVSWHHMRELLVFSVFVFVTSIGDYLRFQMDSVVIARWLTVALVTPFSIASTLMTLFMNVLGAVTGPLMAEQSRLDGAELFDHSRELFLRGTKLTASIALLGGVLLICNGKALLQLWIGRDVMITYPVLIILSLAYVSDLGQGPSINLLRSRERHRAMACWTIAEGVANLLLSIYLGRKYGVLGVAWGTTIPMLITKLIVQPWYVLRIARIRAIDYLAAVAGPLAAALVCIAVSAAIGTRSPSVVSLGAGIVWQTALFGVLAFTFVLNAQDRRVVLRSTYGNCDPVRQ